MAFTIVSVTYKSGEKIHYAMLCINKCGPFKNVEGKKTLLGIKKGAVLVLYVYVVSVGMSFITVHEREAIWLEAGKGELSEIMD